MNFYVNVTVNTETLLCKTCYTCVFLSDLPNLLAIVNLFVSILSRVL